MPDLSLTPSPRPLLPGHPKVASLVAVSSAKGGVGKSTLAAMLGLELAGRGLRVGLLDADIYGPNLPGLLGLPATARAQSSGQGERRRLLPASVHGLRLMSMAMVADPAASMAWRGPMISNAFRQLGLQTEWGELDMLLVDMPPGTGDIQLTLCKAMPPSGALLVTTPHPLSGMDCARGADMFRRLQVPLLGAVQNMAWFSCQECGHRHPLFASPEGGQEAEAVPGLATLASLPLLPQLAAPGALAGGAIPQDAAAPVRQAAEALVEAVNQAHRSGAISKPRILDPGAQAETGQAT